MHASARTLLAGLIDYAGLFPPAFLPMAAAVHNYAHYQGIPFFWVLGCFVVPVLRLEEFERESAPLLPPPGSSAVWRLSLLATDPENDVRQLDDFNRNHSGALFDSIEITAGSPAEIVTARAVTPRALHLYCEIPLAGELRSLVAAMGKSGAYAKVRCGGVSAEMFPSASQVAQFVQECNAAGVGFKATAGLHHPMRGVYPLTYDADSQKGLMHGFLNLFLAAAWVRAGMSGGEAVALLEERSPTAFRFSEDGVNWRGHLLGIEDIVEARRRFALAFGSCSFSEPVADLRKMNLIP